jgi:hypothetical protein
MRFRGDSNMGAKDWGAFRDSLVTDLIIDPLAG